eukprot:Platyproteum_vivax@DN6149_c0_g1_i2.p1
MPAKELPPVWKVCCAVNGVLVLCGGGLYYLGDVGIGGTCGKFIPFLSGYSFKDVSYSGTHGLAITTNNDVFVWGEDRTNNGCLGLGSATTFLQTPTQLPPQDCQFSWKPNGFPTRAFAVPNGSILCGNKHQKPMS